MCAWNSKLESHRLFRSGTHGSHDNCTSGIAILMQMVKDQGVLYIAFCSLYVQTYNLVSRYQIAQVTCTTMCRLKGQRSRSQGFWQSVMVSFENSGDRLLDVSNGHKNHCVHIIFLLKFCSSLYLHSVQEHSGCALITATRDSMVAACNQKNVVDMAAHKK